MSVFTVFNIGTGHARNEPNTLMVRLFNACSGVDVARARGGNAAQYKMINDGIGKSYDEKTGETSSNIFAQITGWGLKDKADDTVDEIIKVRPQTVNLVGHSRGAIISVRIAAKLAEKLPQTKCNLFLVDPVKRSLIGTDHYNAETHANVRLFRQILMENESSWLFEPQKISHGGAATNTVRMPGGHGTATQTGQPIGVVSYALAVNFLRMCGTSMNDSPFTATQLAELYATITLANPARRVNGTIGRQVRDLDDHNTAFRRLGNRSLASQFGATNDFSHHKYFINNDHARHFSSVWPNTFLALAGKVRRIDQPFVSSLRRELSNMRGPASRAFQALPPAFKKLV